MRKSKVLSNSDFVARVREYLPMDAAIWETDADGHPHCDISPENLRENDFFLFDAEALTAVTCAIEEIALEEACGSFLGAIQDFQQFEQLKERYWQLAATLNDVQVIAGGKTPRRNGHVKFCNSDALKKFWLVLYQGCPSQIMLLCEQQNGAQKFDEKKFTGFYTFSEKVIEQAREEVADLLGGKCPELRQFSRLHQIDQATKRVKIEFAREQQALEVAIQKLKNGKYRRENFIREIDKTLERLNQLKTRLPELIVGHGH